VTGRVWPRSLTGQLLLAVALALLLAQGVSSVLLYRAQAERRETFQIGAAAFRLLRASRTGEIDRPPWLQDGPRGRGFRLERSANSPARAGEVRDLAGEANLRQMLAEQDVEVSDVIVIRRRVEHDPLAMNRIAERGGGFGWHRSEKPDRLLVAGIHLPQGQWLVARVFVPPGEHMLIASLIGQTLLIYLVLVGAIALIVRRITRPLANLTGRVARFAETRDAGGQLAPEGPDDIRRLIVAHNAMEGRIAALLDEKDVMLGAIGHDLKTPLASLRVRIESVEDERERGRMAATITEITQSLDDILSLARAGHAREPSEMTELSALVASLVEEYEDMDEPVTLETGGRIVLPLRATWLRRALRNLIDNALRYGHTARVSLAREGGSVLIQIDDDGPGIPEQDMARMLEPFTRGDPSRNVSTGGAGLGLALARAIAEQHGGRLVLANRRSADGAIAGLTAALHLPMSN
jgi:signal transduction histidine kinase